MPIMKKNHNKIKLTSDKTQTKQLNLYFIRRDMGPVFNATAQQVDKKAKTSEIQKYISNFENN